MNGEKIDDTDSSADAQSPQKPHPVSMPTAGSPEHAQAEIAAILPVDAAEAATVADDVVAATDAEREPVAEGPSIYAAKPELTIKKPPSFFAEPKKPEAATTAEVVKASATASVAAVKPSTLFIAAGINTFNPAGESIKMVLFFQIDKDYSSSALQAFFEQNKSNFGAAESIAMDAEFETFAEMEAYVFKHSQTDWNGKDVFWWPAQQLPSIKLN